MNLIRQNAFHFFTVIVFISMIVHCWQNPDLPGWLALFSLIILNAFLFILKKPVSIISWIAMVVGILGMIMSLPVIVKTGIGFVYETTRSEMADLGTLNTVLYFMISFFFSIQQIHRFLKY